MTSLSFAEFGRVYLPIAIKPKGYNTMVLLRFKIDTGADNSTISKQDLMGLGYEMDWIKSNSVAFSEDEKPASATGDKIDSGYIQIPIINILGYEGKQWPFQIILDESRDFRNLLGRDLLTGFNYSFNNDSDVFTIVRANSFKPRYPFLSNQVINEILSNDADFLR